MRLVVAGRLDRVEERQRRLMLGLQRVEPVAGRGAAELDEQFAADIGGEPDRRAGHRRAEQHAGIGAGAPGRRWPPPRFEVLVEPELLRCLDLVLLAIWPSMVKLPQQPLGEGAGSARGDGRRLIQAAVKTCFPPFGPHPVAIEVQTSTQPRATSSASRSGATRTELVSEPAAGKTSS